MNLAPEGSYWAGSSLLWGSEAGEGLEYASLSPLGGVSQTVRLLNGPEVEKLFRAAPLLPPVDLSAPAERLRQSLNQNRAALEVGLRNTTGFTLADCREILDGCDSYLERFELLAAADPADFSHDGRAIGIRRVPWGTIAVILPQNAYITTALICLMSALATGNRIILRVPSGSARMGAILGRLLMEAGFPGDRFSMVLCDAGEFVNAWQTSRSPSLLHYMGSSDRAADMLASAFRAGKPCLVDGEGNSWLYIDRDQDPDVAAELVWQGAVRYNGQTCTSVNGVVVHPDVDVAVRNRLRDLVAQTTFGTSDGAQVGPVFSEGQANHADQLIRESQGRIGRAALVAGNLLPPTLIEDPAEDSDLVTEGLFGPAMWIRTGDYEEFVRLWPANRYPLCGALLSHQIEEGQALRDLAGASRVVINGDPSLEDPMEPWGAYPACGSNPVTHWGEKYLRSVQIDRAV